MFDLQQQVRQLPQRLPPLQPPSPKQQLQQQPSSTPASSSSVSFQQPQQVQIDYSMAAASATPAGMSVFHSPLWSDTGIPKQPAGPVFAPVSTTASKGQSLHSVPEGVGLNSAQSTGPPVQGHYTHLARALSYSSSRHHKCLM